MPSALVTGASTGIGRATALRLDAAGWTVFAGVRREADAERAARGRLRAAGAADPRRHRRRARSRPPRERIAAATGERRARRPRQQRRRSRAQPAGDDADRGLPPAGRGQPDRPGGRHPGDAARDPRGPRPDRLHQLDRRPHRLPDDRRLPRRQVRDRGGGRHLPPGAAALGDLGLDRRAGLDRDPDLGARRARDRRDRRAARPQTRAPLRQSDREVPQGRPGTRRTRGMPPERVAQAIEHALTARRPRTRYLVGLDAKVQARAKHPAPDPALRPDRRAGRSASRPRRLHESRGRSTYTERPIDWSISQRRASRSKGKRCG